MSATRIFGSSEFFQPAEGEPIRSVITESRDAVVVAWYVKPGQETRAHVPQARTPGPFWRAQGTTTSIAWARRDRSSRGMW